MKVIIAGTLAGNGGVQSHIKWLAKALGESGVTTLAISVSSLHNNKIDHLNLKSCWNESVSCFYFPSSVNNKLSQKLSSITRLTKLVKVINSFEPDIYIAVGTGWNLFVPVLLSRSKPVKVFHEVMSGVPTSWRDSRWSVKLWFDEVVGQAEPVSSTFAEKFLWNKSVQTLPAFPEPLEITATLPSVTHRRIQKGNIKAALFSRLAPHKQALWLVKQWDQLKNHLSELHIHGAGPEESQIRQYIAENAIGDRVKCFGRYPEGQAYVDLLSSYDLTLLPTVGAEGAPLVLLESMACGVPFLAYGVGGISDYGINNPDVVIVEPAKNLFFEGMERLCHKLDLGEINQTRLKQFYLEKYSYKSLKIKWIESLSNINV